MFFQVEFMNLKQMQREVLDALLDKQLNHRLWPAKLGEQKSDLALLSLWG